MEKILKNEKKINKKCTSRTVIDVNVTETTFDSNLS